MFGGGALHVKATWRRIVGVGWRIMGSTLHVVANMRVGTWTLHFYDTLTPVFVASPYLSPIPLRSLSYPSPILLSVCFLRYPSSVAALSFNPDGTMLAIASSYMWEQGNKEYVNDCCVSIGAMVFVVERCTVHVFCFFFERSTDSPQSPTLPTATATATTHANPHTSSPVIYHHPHASSPPHAPPPPLRLLAKHRPTRSLSEQSQTKT